MAAEPFSRKDAERRLGPAAVLAIRRLAATAPPLTAEQGMALRILFGRLLLPVHVGLVECATVGGKVPFPVHCSPRRS